MTLANLRVELDEIRRINAAPSGLTEKDILFSELRELKELKAKALSLGEIKAANSLDRMIQEVKSMIYWL